MEDYPIRVLYDGQCPLCSREIAMLKRRDRHGRIAPVDIAAPEFDAAAFGLTDEQVNARIHAVLPDGRVIEGLAVFRRLYAAIGMGWVMAWTGWPILRRLADAAYALFARNRHRLTGRCEAACSMDRPN